MKKAQNSLKQKKRAYARDPEKFIANARRITTGWTPAHFERIWGSATGQVRRVWTVDCTGIAGMVMICSCVLITLM